MFRSLETFQQGSISLRADKALAQIMDLLLSSLRRDCKPELPHYSRLTLLYA